MTCVEIPDSDHVARYCKPRTLNDDGTPSGFAFLPRTSDEYLSVNWLEYFKEPRTADSIKKLLAVFRRKKFETKQSGKFAVIQVSDAKAAVHRTGKNLRIKRCPANLDESHAGMFGYDSTDLEIAEEIAHAVKRDDLYRLSDVR